MTYEWTFLFLWHYWVLPCIFIIGVAYLTPVTCLVAARYFGNFLGAFFQFRIHVLRGVNTRCLSSRARSTNILKQEKEITISHQQQQ